MPRGGILENVMGLARELDTTGFDDDGQPLPESWLLRVLEELRTLGHFYSILALDAKQWVEAPRDRLS